MGFLCFTAGSMSQILDLILQVPEHAGSPLLLPCLISWIFSSIQRRQLRDIHNFLTVVQREIGALDRFLKTSDANASMARQAKFDDIHLMLVEQHNRLTIGLAEYVSLLGDMLDQGLDQVRAIRDEWDLDRDEDVDGDFRKYIWHCQSTQEGRGASQQRDRLLSRIDIQLKMVRPWIDGQNWKGC
jgi:hypothetical protein